MSNIPESLVKALQSNSLIPLVGAGVSMAIRNQSGDQVFPSWTQLLHGLAEKLEKETLPKDADYVRMSIDMGNFQVAAEHAYKKLQKRTWIEFFKQQFAPDFSTLNEPSTALYKAIWGLGSGIITLNYDEILENYHPDSKRPESITNRSLAELAQFTDDPNRPQVWHLHGSINQCDDLVLTGEQYNCLYTLTDKMKANYQAALDTLQTLITKKSLLFIGCSLSDVELLAQIKQQRDIFAGNTANHYALIKADENHAVQDKLRAAGLNIQLITFEDFGEPLINKIQELSACRQAVETPKANTPTEAKAKPQESSESPKIALLTAKPLGDDDAYQKQLTTKIPYPVELLALTIDNLNNLEGFDYVMIFSKVIKHRLLIEDAYLAPAKIRFEELEEQLGLEQPKGVFVLVDQLPNADVLEELDLPLLISTLDDPKKLLFGLAKKQQLPNDKYSMCVGDVHFDLAPLKNKITAATPPKAKMPEHIDHKAIKGFVGRDNDLRNISRSVCTLEQEGGLLTIKGAGGIGKTTLAKKLALAYAERGLFDGGIVFIDCEPIPDHEQFRYKVCKPFLLEQAVDMHAYLREHHDQKHRLIILDNFETLLYLNDINAIKATLAIICDYATVLITSREVLGVDGENVEEIRQFTTDEAEELFLASSKRKNPQGSERALLRESILEEQLDNNPLAIKLVTANLPKVVSLRSLAEDLKDDLFNKVSEQDLASFDSDADININKKKSIYVSILYSYNKLSNQEQQAFELLALFPDGVHLDNLKKMSSQQNNKDIPVQKSIFSDKVIKALENKSMILSANNGVIKLQSIVRRFADAQLKKRDNIRPYLNKLFDYNNSILLMLNSMRLHYQTENSALQKFDLQKNNFFKPLQFFNEVDIDQKVLLNYLQSLLTMIERISSCFRFAEALETVKHDFDKNYQLTINVMQLFARYFDGDFDESYKKLREIMPLDLALEQNRVLGYNRLLSNIAMNIYVMEGVELIQVCIYTEKNNIMYNGYSPVLFEIGVHAINYAKNAKYDFFGLQVLQQTANLALTAIDKFQENIYEADHLSHMQISYLRCKMQALPKGTIKKLVVINPYTQGLKTLMLAFIEQDNDHAEQLYQQAIDDLRHIHYYYVEALYLYAKFLQEKIRTGFDEIYQKGLNLSKKHHYRYLNYCFDQLLNPTEGGYNEQDYPLPVEYDFGPYIKELIDYNIDIQKQAHKC